MSDFSRPRERHRANTAKIEERIIRNRRASVARYLHFGSRTMINTRLSTSRGKMQGFEGINLAAIF